MKKLMFAAAVAAGLVAIGDGLESSNTVGYQGKDVAVNLSNQMPTFEAVGSEGTDIANLQPLDEDGEPLSGEITIQFYNAFGFLAENYTWWKGEDVDEGMDDGWFDDDMEEPKTRALAFGEGFKIYTTYEGGKLMYAGEGKTAEVAIPIPVNLSSLGNVRPIDIDLSDLVPVDENGDPVSGEITVQFYNEFGFLAENYTWWKGEDVDEGMDDGWFDDDMEEPKTRALVAGEGFCVYTTYDGAFLKFPAVQ
jgi:hypothetical protein